MLFYYSHHFTENTFYSITFVLQPSRTLQNMILHTNHVIDVLLKIKAAAASSAVMAAHLSEVIQF